MIPNNLAFVGDIGGTNARFALVESGRLVTESLYSCINRNYSSTVDALRSFLATHGSPKVSGVCLALACPITGDTVKLTNCDWEFSRDAIRAALGIDQVLFVNDFTALAMGVPALGTHQYFSIGGGTPQPRQPIGVMGPGTGFGVSGLVWGGREWIAIQGEGGHIGFAPYDEVEMEILRAGRKEYGGRLSVERILSGDGLEFLYRTLSQIKGQPAEKLKAADITREAIAKPDSLSREVVNIFCGILGSAAGDLALILGAFGGVYIGGGIMARLRDIAHQTPFRERFEAKARFKNYISRIPTYVITDSVHVALMGAATILNNSVN